jgi:hypothetical protein
MEGQNAMDAGDDLERIRRSSSFLSTTEGVTVRRRISRTLAMTALLASLTSPGIAVETIERFIAEIEMQPSGALAVTETIRVRAEGDRIRRGIYRDFPLTIAGPEGGTDRVGFQLRSIARDGKPEPHFVRRSPERVRIYFGDENVLLPHGTYTYTISYITDDQVRISDDLAELYWNVTGNEWAFPILSAEGRLALPDGAEPTRWTAYTGAYGARGQDWEGSVDSDGVLRVRTSAPLAPGEGLTIVAGIPEGVLQPRATAAARLDASYGPGDIDCRHNPDILYNPLGPPPLAIRVKARVGEWRELADGRAAEALLERIRRDAEAHCAELRRRENIRGEVLDHVTVEIESARGGRTAVAVRGTYGKGQWNIRNEAVRWAEEDRRREEERRRRETAEAERKRQEEARRAEQAAKAEESRRLFEAFAGRAGIATWPSLADLRANPFVYRDRIVGIRARFDAMVAEDEAVFTAGGGPVHVSGVPIVRFRQAGAPVLLAATVAGLKQMEMFGAPMPVPHLDFVDAHFCADKNCDDVLFWVRQQQGERR